MFSIRKSFSTKLSLGILLLAAPIFVVSLGMLFTQSRRSIRMEAVGHANSVLDAAMERICRNLLTIETATNANYWLVTQYLDPDSLLALTHRLVYLNPHIDGCSVSVEPNVFPKYGGHFSAYTVREDDTVRTVIEEEYDYFDKIWYKTPRHLGRDCWVAYFDESDTLTLTIDGLVASYGRPLYDANKRFVGVISTDLSLLRLSKIVSSEEKPFPHSYFMMVDKDGNYFIHPDSTRLFTQGIFTDADPLKQADLIALGHEMTAGKYGSMAATIDGVPCIVCYQPVPDTSWSLALVSPESDILRNYHWLTNIVVSLLVIGLFVILLLCHRTVALAIKPLNQLLVKTQSIAEGNMEIHIAQSSREDAVGRLQNSFAAMLQSLNFHMGSVRYTADQSRLRNEELLKATRLAKEADRQKTAFIQNVSHQIRTPLNIIMGFAQVLNDTASNSSVRLSEEELKSIISTMDYNSKLLSRMVLMLFDSSETGLTEELNSQKHDKVSCNDVAHESITYIKLHYPSVDIDFQTELADDFCVRTSRLYLMRSLREILYNSAKYSDGLHVMLRVFATESTVRFIVQDKGKGIAVAERESMFEFFTKQDDLSEGLGLGLPLAKRHARNLGGDLTLDEDYHDGCRFILELPLE